MACVSCTNTILTSGASMHGSPLEKSLNRQWKKKCAKTQAAKDIGTVFRAFRTGMFFKKA